MANTYKIESSKVFVGSRLGVKFTVGFGEPAQNDVIVRDTEALMVAISAGNNLGGEIAIVNGPASLPVAMVLAHHLAHRFGAVACFDPKMGAYVVAISHLPDMGVGSVLGATEVK